MSKIEEYKAVNYPFPNNREKPKPGEMQVMVEADGTIEAVDFLCPCGCGRNSYTPVVTMEEKSEPKKRHAWGYDPVTVTLHPSILWLSGCKSHFWIKNGKVVWC